MLTDRNKQYPIQNKSQLLYPVTKGIIYPLSVIVPNNRTKYLMTGAVTAQKLKFSIKDFFSKCDQIGRKLRKTLMENFIFCAVSLFGKKRDQKQ